MAVFSIFRNGSLGSLLLGNNNVIYNSVKLLTYRWGREQEPAEVRLERVEYTDETHYVGLTAFEMQ